jgi:hypothetical protein
MLPAPPIELGGGWLAGLLAGRRGPHRAPGGHVLRMIPPPVFQSSSRRGGLQAPCMARRCMMMMTCLVAAAYKNGDPPGAYI